MIKLCNVNNDRPVIYEDGRILENISSLVCNLYATGRVFLFIYFDDESIRYFDDGVEIDLACFYSDVYRCEGFSIKKNNECFSVSMVKGGQDIALQVEEIELGFYFDRLGPVTRVSFNGLGSVCDERLDVYDYGAPYKEVPA